MQRIAPKAVDRFAQERSSGELTGRNRGVSIERMAEELSRYLQRDEDPRVSRISGSVKRHRCWQVLEQWLRRRLRSAIWKQWKRGPARFAEITPERTVNADLAAQTARPAIMVLGGWRTRLRLASHCPMPISTRSGFRD